MQIPNRATAGAIVAAGAVAGIAFELYAWLVSPLLFGVRLAPANLVIALTQIATGLQISYVVAFVLHILTGVLGFSALVYGLHRASGLGFYLSGLLSGVGLWFVAQGILAPIVGRSFMMGFGAYTQSSFVGHVGMCLVLGMVLHKLTERQQAQQSMPDQNL